MRNRRTIIAIALLSLLALLYLQLWLSARKKEEQQLLLEKEADVVQALLMADIEARLNISNYLKTMVLLRPDMTEDTFALIAEEIIQFNPPVRAIEMTDNKTRVIRKYPVKGNQVSLKEPIVLLDDPERGRYVRKALETGKPTLQPPFELFQGGLGIVIRNPIYNNGDFLGLAIVVMDFPTLFTKTLPEEKRAKVHLSISPKGAPPFYGQIPEEAPTAKRDLHFADALWELSIAWRGEALDSWTQNHLAIILLSGALIAAVFTLFLFITKRNETLRTKIRASTAELQNEIEARIEYEAALQESERIARELLEEKETLLSEVHHRIKNNLNTVSSLLSLQAARSPDEGLKKALGEAQNRIKSMTILYERLYQSGNIKSLPLSSFLSPLAQSIIDLFPHRKAVALKTDLSDDEFPVKSLIPLGIITNELITNSFKHGFTGRDQNTIFISLRRQDDGHYRMLYTDNGGGAPPAVTETAPQGLGTKLIAALAAQLDGTVEHPDTETTGYAITITFPIPQ